MKFIFKAKTKEGEIREGIMEAVSSEAAAAFLQKNNLFPIRIIAEKERDYLSKALLKYYDKVNAKEMVVFFRQLAILIEARVPIVVSLSAIREQSSNQYFIRILKEIIDDIEDGTTFSDALSKHKDVFSNLSINIIKAGETSGNLKKSVEYVADNIERNYILSSRVKSALLYPAVILTVFFIIGFLVVTIIIPKLTQVIKDLNAEIPWYTQMVIVAGDFMSTYWWAVLIIILGIIGGAWYYINTSDGRKEWDQLKIRLPILGPLFSYICISRFAENLSVLLAGGIPIIRALTIVSSVIGNTVYEKVFLETAERVKMGGDISDNLKDNPLIPPVVSHMIKIGEESGQMDSILKHIAKFYDQETETITKNLSTLIEPVLMVIIGIGVGFFSFAVLMPIYNIAGQIQ